MNWVRTTIDIGHPLELLSSLIYVAKLRNTRSVSVRPSTEMNNTEICRSISCHQADEEPKSNKTVKGLSLTCQSSAVIWMFSDDKNVQKKMLQ